MSERMLTIAEKRQMKAVIKALTYGMELCEDDEKSLIKRFIVTQSLRINTDSWYDSKYDSTEQENRSFLIFPHYGEFYPLYKEEVDIVFPADVEKGTLHVELYTVIEGQEDQQFAELSFYFKRENGVLTLDPNDR